MRLTLYQWRIYAMTMIPHKDCDGQMLYTVIEKFLSMFQTVKSVFRITDEQLEAFAAEFYSRLPEYMQKSLSYTQSRGSEAICHG